MRAKQKNVASGSPKSEPKTQQRDSNVSAAPLTPDELVKGIFQIKPEDVKRVLASKPGKKQK
jgi:hypothetical protein